MNTQKWKEYFIFSKKERIAVLILLVIIFLLVVLPFFIIKKPEPVKIDPKLQQQIALLNNDSAGSNTNSKDEDNYQQSYSKQQDSQPSDQAVHRELFKFDPNTATENDFKRLGLRDKTIKTLINYRSKGGHFYKPEDLHKIYGLHEEEATALIPYVQIASSQKTYQKEEKPEYTKPQNQQPATSAPKKQYAAIDINTATAEEWKSLPGIGDVLSNRIVKFRNKIGGFNSVEQVKQTYGLSDSTFQIIKPLLKFSAPK